MAFMMLIAVMCGWLVSEGSGADFAAFALGQEDQCLRAENLWSNMLIARLIQFGVNIKRDVL
jgi:hypothetical protein